MTHLVARTQALVVVSCAFIACACVVCAASSCGPPAGSENGPCDVNDRCSAALVCDETSHCVRSCAGDAGGAHSEAQCARIATASCGSQGVASASESACVDAARTLRPGVFDAAFACLSAIPASTCTSSDPNALASAANHCVVSVDACANPAAEDVCQQASDACSAAGDDTFDFSGCIVDLEPANDAFNNAWTACFDNNLDGCADVESVCASAADSAVAGANP